MTLFDRLFPASGGANAWVLIDPDETPPEQLQTVVRNAEKNGASAFLIGGSFLIENKFEAATKAIKDTTTLPVVLFPGNSRQISSNADGILFTSLLSGRNPQFLIGEQVMAAPYICKSKLEAVPTGYLLIESGRMSSTEYVSDTKPLPRDKPYLAVAHAQAAMLFGMKAVYLEAGSGVEQPVPAEMIRLVAEHVSIPLIVGGGIVDAGQAVAAVRAGARAIVIGTSVERRGEGFIREVVGAIEGDKKSG